MGDQSLWSNARKATISKKRSSSSPFNYLGGLVKQVAMINLRRWVTRPYWGKHVLSFSNLVAVIVFSFLARRYPIDSTSLSLQTKTIGLAIVALPIIKVTYYLSHLFPS